MYNFDEIVDRKDTRCKKFGFIERENKPKDILPMWIADTDFIIPGEIQEALHSLVDHGSYSYHFYDESYLESVKGWFRTRYDFELKDEWYVTTPGICPAIGLAILSYTEPGDSVMVQQPVYDPFSNTIVNGGRKLVDNTLVRVGNRYEIDFDDFERKIKEEDVKVFLLCSPHNPVGRVWTREELQKIGDICLENKVIVVSDEIHCDFVFPDLGRRHYLFPSVDERFLENTVLCTAPGKTFNISGTQTSNIFIANEELRNKFKATIDIVGMSHFMNIFGKVACETAYKYGGQWVDEMNLYLQRNRDYVRDFVKREIKEIEVIESDGLFLMWLDCRSLGMTSEELGDFLDRKAKVWVNNGAIYGKSGEGYIRLNIGTNRRTLEEGLTRIKNAIDNL